MLSGYLDGLNVIVRALKGRRERQKENQRGGTMRMTQYIIDFGDGGRGLQVKGCRKVLGAEKQSRKYILSQRFQNKQSLATILISAQ